MNNNICAIIVTYNPEPTDVKTLIERITPSVDRIVIVDNGSKDSDMIMSFAKQDAKVDICFLGDNFGVATAQNVGIKLALEDNFKFIILFDHDSLPDVGMINNLLDAYKTLHMQGIRVAAVGANWRERNSGVRWRNLSEERPFFKEEMVISSGCLIPAEALLDIGLMLDNLFIDHIDAEWCMRATEKYREHNKRMETDRCWKIFIVSNALMGHSLGRGTIKLGIGIGGILGSMLGAFGGLIGVLLGASISVTNAIFFGLTGALLGGTIAKLANAEAYWASPARLYFGFRNSVYLWTRSSYILRWKLRDAFFRVAQFSLVCLGVYPTNRFSLMKLVFRGIWHGITGKLGPISGVPIKDEITYTLVSQGSVKEKIYKLSDSAINQQQELVAENN